MFLIRFGERGSERPGIQKPDGTRIDVSRFGEDYNEIFFATNGLHRLEAWLAENADQCPVIDEHVRLGPPVCRPSKIICVGLNFASHAAESKMDIPKEPVLFFKATSSITGPFDDVVIPREGKKVDWEVELACVIKSRASYIDEAHALTYVAGYMLHNDVSERVFQLERGGQWVKGKSADTFAPIGPYLVTPDDISDPHTLDLWLKVNGNTMQSSNTADFIFGIPALISYISRFMTLLPGDIISTGTPFGVGLGLDPPKYLKAGDIMELGITGLGTARQRVVAFGPGKEN
jgi:2,4-diketo-3-deoxy-L-fuconate hydrolase